jgi:hypothetical protein
VSAFLDQLPIAYTLRIETSGARVYQHTHVQAEVVDGEPEQGEGDGIARSAQH